MVNLMVNGVCSRQKNGGYFMLMPPLRIKKNLLLASLQTNYFQARALSRQIVIVDACANYTTDQKERKRLTKLFKVINKVVHPKTPKNIDKLLPYLINRTAQKIRLRQAINLNQKAPNKNIVQLS